MHTNQHYEPMFDLQKTRLSCANPGHPSGRPGTKNEKSTHMKKVSPTAAPCTTQLPMSCQVCAPQFYQRMTARSIFDRCGDRHECSNFSHPAYPIGTPTHEKEKFHSPEKCVCRPPRHVQPNSPCRVRYVHRKFINE